MRRWLTILLSPCIFGHAADPLYARDAQGRAYWECARCMQPILARTSKGNRVPFRLIGTRSLKLVRKPGEMTRWRKTA